MLEFSSHTYKISQFYGSYLHMVVIITTVSYQQRQQVEQQWRDRLHCALDALLNATKNEKLLMTYTDCLI